MYCQLEAAGLIEIVATEERIRYFEHEPPQDTRAWTRAMLLRSADPTNVVGVDWDRVTIRRDGEFGQRLSIELPNPLQATKADSEHNFHADADLESLFAELPPSGEIKSLLDQ